MAKEKLKFRCPACASFTPALFRMPSRLKPSSATVVCEICKTKTLVAVSKVADGLSLQNIEMHMTDYGKSLRDARVKEAQRVAAEEAAKAAAEEAELEEVKKKLEEKYADTNKDV